MVLDTDQDRLDTVAVVRPAVRPPKLIAQSRPPGAQSGRHPPFPDPAALPDRKRPRLMVHQHQDTTQGPDHDHRQQPRMETPERERDRQASPTRKTDPTEDHEGASKAREAPPAETSERHPVKSQPPAPNNTGGATKR